MQLRYLIYLGTDYWFSILEYCRKEGKKNFGIYFLLGQKQHSLSPLFEVEEV